MNRKSTKNLKAVLGRRPDRMAKKRRRFYYDPFFADADTVEDDYRRLNGPHLRNWGP